MYEWYPLQQHVGILEPADPGAINLAESSKTSMTVVGDEDGIAYVIPTGVVEAFDSVPPGELHQRIECRRPGGSGAD